ncbi:hypothetical protein AB0G15_42380 [Streptosporangium sp. NPDC023825]|uniref:hypothetical protein n=1 Tax=Streptosporangium sp. NPDC023825 TaxID=3154909 RepID=UPI0034345D0B
MTQAAERVERLCTLLETDDDLWDSAEKVGAGTLLQRIVAAISAGDHNALPPLLDAFDEAMAVIAGGAITLPTRAYEPIIGWSDGHPVVHAWTCPAPTPCTRVDLQTRPDQPSVCAATGQSLALIRVST